MFRCRQSQNCQCVFAFLQMGEINRHSASRHHRRVPPLHGAVMHRTLLVQVRHNCKSADVARAHIKPDEIGLNGLQISVTIKQNNDPSSISKSPSANA